MTDLHNPLFEDEKEFLEHQKLEYERALLGEVEEIKAKSQEVGKYVAIGAGVLGGIWLLKKAFGGKKKHELNGHEEEDDERSHGRRYLQNAPRRPYRSVATDDFGPGTSSHHYDRGRMQAAGHLPQREAVYHTDADPFQPMGFEAGRSVPARRSVDAGPSMLQTFLQSDAGKMLVAQASAVLMAFVAKKAGEYFPMLKNPDLAPSGTASAEPETKDIDFTFHDDADAPHQPLRSSEHTPDARPEVTGYSA